MLGGEGVAALHLCAEGCKDGDGAFVLELFDAECFRSPAKRAAQPVKGQVSLGQYFSPRLKISERVKH
jgi:hypothetical protein